MLLVMRVLSILPLNFKVSEIEDLDQAPFLMDKLGHSPNHGQPRCLVSYWSSTLSFDPYRALFDP